MTEANVLPFQSNRRPETIYIVIKPMYHDPYHIYLDTACLLLS